MMGGSKKSQGGGGLLGGRRAAAPTATRRRRAQPATSSVPATRPQAKAAPAPAQSGSGGGMGSGMMGMVAQGMAFGAGSAVAHRAIGAVADGISGGGKGKEQDDAQQHSSAPQAVEQDGPCDKSQANLYQCLSDQSGNAAACQFFFDALRDCQDNQRYAQSYQ